MQFNSSGLFGYLQEDRGPCRPSRCRPLQDTWPTGALVVTVAVEPRDEARNNNRSAVDECECRRTGTGQHRTAEVLFSANVGGVRASRSDAQLSQTAQTEEYCLNPKTATAIKAIKEAIAHHKPYEDIPLPSPTTQSARLTSYAAEKTGWLAIFKSEIPKNVADKPAQARTELCRANPELPKPL